MAIELEHAAQLRDDLTESHDRSERAASIEELVLSADSDQTPVLSIVLPTQNEEAGIGACLERIESAVLALGVPTEVIVSDGSTDRTPAIAREWGAIVVTPDEPGYGYAYQYAFEQVRGSYIVMADADTTYDFEELPQLLATLIEEDADIVMGSRFEGEIEAGAMPALHRYVGNPLLTTFLNVFYDAGVTDAHSGYRVLTQEALETLDLSSRGMEFASEMIMDAGARDLEIREVPITYSERTGEATLNSFRDGWRHIRFMLVNAPGYLFSVPGLLMFGVGVLVMGCAYFDVDLGPASFGVHSMIVGSLLSIVGAQVAGFGVFATVANNPIRQANDPITTRVTQYATLERVATMGVLVFGAGAVYGVWMVSEWVASGFTHLPFVMADVVALTAVVLGIQTVFSAFFFSALAQTHTDP